MGVLWPGISVFIGGVASGVVLYYLLARRRTPRLAYDITQQSRLITLDPRARNRFEVTFDGNPVESVFLYRVEAVARFGRSVEALPLILRFTEPKAKIFGVGFEHSPLDKQKYLEAESHYPITPSQSNPVPLTQLDWPLTRELKIYIKPGMDPGDRTRFDVFTTADPSKYDSPLSVQLGTVGVKWKRGLPSREPPWYYLAPFVIIGPLVGILVSVWLMLLTGIKDFPPGPLTFDNFLLFVEAGLVIVAPFLVFLGLFMTLGEYLWKKLTRR